MTYYVIRNRINAPFTALICSVVILLTRALRNVSSWRVEIIVIQLPELSSTLITALELLNVLQVNYLLQSRLVIIVLRIPLRIAAV